MSKAQKAEYRRVIAGNSILHTIDRNRLKASGRYPLTIRNVFLEFIRGEKKFIEPYNLY